MLSLLHKYALCHLPPLSSSWLPWMTSLVPRLLCESLGTRLADNMYSLHVVYHAVFSFQVSLWSLWRVLLLVVQHKSIHQTDSMANWVFYIIFSLVPRPFLSCVGARGEPGNEATLFLFALGCIISYVRMQHCTTIILFDHFCMYHGKYWSVLYFDVFFSSQLFRFFYSIILLCNSQIGPNFLGLTLWDYT